MSIAGQDTNTEGKKHAYQPTFYRLNKKEDKIAFDKLKEAGNVTVYDEIHDQLKELIKSRNPQLKLKPEDYGQLIQTHLNGIELIDYGVWVYYPWSGRAVHILDEAEFIELRTSANRNKITTIERDVLSTKKVGVIGLSVGQSVAVTLAMERICGELRLADFDRLELNNLNRIRTGLHNLGILKAYSVAREIAELDPYFKTVCYIEGITEGNIDDFFTAGGKLDVVIDECDSVDVKLLCRIKAKELSVPVLMEASDKGTLDVERYDLEPNRPIMHGWLEHLSLDFDVLRNLKTSDEKLPYMLPIAGLDTLSPRLKASVIEMSVSITTWPQLATAVTLGGALTADTCRRMFLNEHTDSGRYFIDLESLVPDTRPKERYELPALPVELTREKMEAIIAPLLTNKQNVPANGLDNNMITQLVGKAISAPSLYNSQPWKWLYRNGSLFLFHDKRRSPTYSDFDGTASYIALGGAIENLEIAAFEKGIGLQVELFPAAEEMELVAEIKFTEVINGGLYNAGELGKYIDSTGTNRSMAAGAGIDTAILNDLRNAAESIDGVQLIIKDTEEDLKALSDILGPSERLKLLHAPSHHEFFEWLRWEKGAIDGLDINTLDLSDPEILALKITRSPEVVRYLREWNGGRALEFTARKTLAKASAVGIIVVSGMLPAISIASGKAIERMRLTAAKNNISIYPFQSIITNLARVKESSSIDMPQNVQQEVNKLTAGFRGLIPEIKESNALFLFSIAMHGNANTKELRRPISEVLLLN